jgi:AraC-like DNA-binding protein
MKASDRPPPVVLGRAAQGLLLELKVDLTQPMGIAHERSLNFFKDNHAHERIVICAARGSTRAEIRDAQTDKTYINRREVVIFKPAKFLHSVRSLATVYDDFALLPTVDLMQQMALSRGHNRTQIKNALSQCRELPRTEWLNQLLERYFCLRILAPFTSEQKDRPFFEEQILVEILSLLLGQRQDQRSTSAHPGELLRAVEWIETHLFDDLNLQKISSVAGASRSTLIRLFQEHLQISPAQYVRNRRLDEARSLINKGEYSISEVAELVGYADASAFSRAFRSRFKVSPKSKS